LGCTPEIEIYNVAIGGRRRRVSISTSGGTGGSIYGSAAITDTSGSEVVEVWTLEDVLKGDEFDLVKIDIEGAEHEIFDSPSHLSLKQCRCVIMEIHSRHGSERKVVDALAWLGFAVTGEPVHVGDGTGVWCFARADELRRSP